MRKVMLWVCLVSACGCGRAKDEPEPAVPTAAALLQYHEASTRLVDNFLEAGTWVVSRKPDGSPDHLGEGLLWSGTAMAALSCADGQRIEDGLIDMVTRGDGALVRIEPLGEYEGGREVTVDGALGFYRGVAHRIVACPGSAEKWKPAISLHLAYLEANGGRLNAAAPAKLEDEYLKVKVGFWDVLNQIAFRLALKSSEPDGGRIKAFALGVAAWVLPGNVAHVPAYRNNLALLALQSLEELGRETPQAGRDAFCAATRGVDIPTVDHFCGRGDIKGWVAGFHPNEWEFRHQRSGSWESPDAGGDKTPALDLLVGIKQGYAIQD